jgi:four helix bundle protein
MENVRPNPVLDKSYAFALKIIEVGRRLQVEKKEFVLSRQVIRSGTSIGANIEEATASLSRKDFAARMGVASKEARETRYWLRLLGDSGYMDRAVADPLIVDCGELIKMLTAIVKSAQSAVLPKSSGLRVIEH